MALKLINPGPLQTVGTALIERLRLAFPPTLFQHEMMPAKLTPQVWTALVRRTPFVGLGWGSLVPQATPARSFRGVSHWTVFLVTRNSSGETGRYFGDAQGPGLFQMVQAATLMLQGFDIGGSGSANVGTAQNVVAEGWEGGGAVIAAVDVEVSIDMSLADMIDATSVDMDALKTTAVTWDFLPGADGLTDIITMGTP